MVYIKLFNKGDILQHDLGRLYIYMGRVVDNEVMCIVRNKDGVVRHRYEYYLTKVESVTNKVMLSMLEME